MRSTARVFIPNLGALLVSSLVLAACGDDGGGTGGGGSGGSASTGTGTGTDAGTGTGTDAGTGTDTGTGTGTDTGTGTGTDTGTGAGTGTDTGTGTGSGSGGGSNLEWTTLITGEWSLEPGGEDTNDVHTLTLDRPYYIGGIRPIAPFGTHHTVLSIDNLDPSNYVYASGVDTNELVFPEGVAVLLPEGANLLLQLHVFNPSGDPITQVSGIEIVEIAPEDVVHEADLFLPGPVDFVIDPNAETTYGTTCTVTEEQTLFALFPHMHQLGSHFTTTLTVGGQDTVLHDAAYEFDHQPFMAIDPVTLQPGDAITTECTWNNTTNQTVTWGESSTAEMCFSIFLRWPAQPGPSFCP